MAAKRVYVHRTVVGAVKTNDRAKALTALRNRIARSIDECDSMRDLAALSRQLTDVLRQLEELQPAPAAVGSPVDEVSKRRAARGAAPARRARTARQQ